MLISLYKKLKEDPEKKDTFELVFVSLDRDEGQYNEYTADMPWKCIPFSTPPEMHQKLAMKYKAEGIPHLVVLDEDRKIITMEGTGEVSMDPEGEKFPWKPKTFSEIWPKQVLTKSGLIDSSTLDKKHLMLYFSGALVCWLSANRLHHRNNTIQHSSSPYLFYLMHSPLVSALSGFHAKALPIL